MGAMKIMRRPVKPKAQKPKVTPKPAPPPKPRMIPFYDQSRIVPREQLTVVTDMRQTGAERGEVQEGDSGTLGPGSAPGPFVTPVKSEPLQMPEKKLSGTQLALLALAGYLVFGG